MAEVIKKKQENQIITLKPTSNVETVNISVFENQKNKGLINYYRDISTLPKKISDCTFEKSVVKSKRELETKTKLEKYCTNFEKALKHGIGLQGLSYKLDGNK